MKPNILIISLAAIVLLVGCAPNTKQNATENPTIEAIMARRSVRYYTDQPVGRDTLMKLAELGVNAPNAMNRQDWAVRIVDDSEFLNGVTDIMKRVRPEFAKSDDPRFRNAFRNAPAVIFVACPINDPMDMCAINAGLLCENICLAAQSMGLGTCVMAAPVMFMSSTEESLPYLQKLNIPEGYKLSICVGVGHPDEEPEAKVRDLSKIQFVD